MKENKSYKCYLNFVGTLYLALIDLMMLFTLPSQFKGIIRLWPSINDSFKIILIIATLILLGFFIVAHVHCIRMWKK